MAEEPLSIRGIHWRDALPFTHLFRAFRVAVHPSKIVLALAALLLLYAGGHLLDWVWPVQDRAVPDEVVLYEQFDAHAAPGLTFVDVRRAHRAAIEQGYAERLLADRIVPTPAAAMAAAHAGKDLGDIKAHILDRRAQAVAEADAERQRALSPANPDHPAPSAVQDRYRAAVRAAYDEASAQYRAASRILNVGLFDTFFEYEAVQVSNLVQGVREWNWFGASRGAAASAALPEADTSVIHPLAPAVGDVERQLATAASATSSPGILPSVLRFFAVGPYWLLTQHPLYFALFGTGFLILWSVFGGAISRIAAVHVARDEKLSIRAALVFSVGKFLSFLCAPLIPLGILAVVGLLTAFVSMLGWIPGIGPVLLGLGFVFALLAGLVMAGVLVGLTGGFNLMYPTIAVEGSDSFDAISRSFSYLYARPWRLAVYTAASVVYGAACYMFVKLFIFLVLALTHRFVGLGVLARANSTAPLLQAMWPNPATAGRLTYSVDTLGLTVAQEVGAGLIWFWVHLVIAVLGAFVVCFYFSSNTIIYYLLRRDVDATDLNEVYVDPSDEDDLFEPDPTDPVPTPPEGGRLDAGLSIAPPAVAADAAPPT